MEPAREATDPDQAAGRQARADASTLTAGPGEGAVSAVPPLPPPASAAVPMSGPENVAGPIAGLVYYAVWLPTPGGGVQGPPIYLPAGLGAGGVTAGADAVPGMGHGAFLPPRPDTPATASPPAGTEQAHNQRLLVWAIILGVMAVHLPWIAYLVAVHGCWGTFLDACFQAPVGEALLAEEADPFAETVGDPYLFARIVFLLLRVQAVLSSDWAEYSQAMQLSTGLGSFVLTRIVAANGLVTRGREKAIYLAALCMVLFVILFWAELHLTSDSVHPLLGDDTVLDYISQTLPPDFASYGSVRDGLLQLLQFLRLADALILGACLALPSTQRKPA